MDDYYDFYPGEEFYEDIVEDRWGEDEQCGLFDAGMYEDEPLPHPVVVVKGYL